jgi:hypothetical protein
MDNSFFIQPLNHPFLPLKKSVQQNNAQVAVTKRMVWE